ncbi:hypothetical protein PSACC_02822 [Paramicrosporidium saccamoebae]|uniref:Uncharacterized protein n=1 Tax=Paramicrosporidium saccamoebae TaxID=1246581 RepID=A0A2H9THW1_9FUNG|nr:hypothetical protein PSACC_02822 [Paramicrosporidium saccamoebae]
MFTPRSTPSHSPLLKDGSPESLFSDMNLTILRQLMNDCDVSVFGALDVDSSRLDVREKAQSLIKSILKENRASTLLFDSLTTSRHATTFMRSITAGFLRFLGQDSRPYVQILALLASETGRGELLGASVLSRLVAGQPELVQGIVYGLVRTILGAEYCPVAGATLSFVLEHPESRVLGCEMLMHALLEDAQLSERLHEFLWERLLMGDLMAEFILFRILHGSETKAICIGKTPSKLVKLTKLIRSDFATPGKYPNVYLHLCLLHTVLDNEETLGTLSQANSPKLELKGWFSPRPVAEPDLEFVLCALLDILIENLNSQRDLYQHSVVSAILTNIFVDQGPRCTEMIMEYQESKQNEAAGREFICSFLPSLNTRHALPAAKSEHKINLLKRKYYTVWESSIH